MGKRTPAQRLTEEQQAWIVTQLAMFRTPSQVSKELKERWGVDFPRQRVEYYDPTKQRAKTNRIAKKWVQLFETTRQEYLRDISQVPIANRKWRLEQLQKLYDNAPDRNVKLRADLLVEAEKFTGDAYSNKRQHELSTPQGPLEIVVTRRIIRPGDGDA